MPKLNMATVSYTSNKFIQSDFSSLCIFHSKSFIVFTSAWGCICPPCVWKKELYRPGTLISAPTKIQRFRVYSTYQTQLQNYSKSTGDPKPKLLQPIIVKKIYEVRDILLATDCELVPALIPVIFYKEFNFTIKVFQPYKGGSRSWEII